MKKIITFCTILFTAGALLWAWGGATAQSQAAAPQVNYDLGYGFNVAVWDVEKLQEMGFTWIKVFNPPGAPLPVKVLYRVEATAAHLGDLEGFRSSMQSLAQNNGAYIDAYEIGNEVNLDASYGWTAAPVAADYVQLLCVAYEELKAHDPTAVVVSAGLAPTGRVTGNWEGHPGHNGLYQDEREFTKEFLTAGGADCLDAFGYHNYGFRAGYAAEPDVDGGTPETYCTNGFCFRGVEKIREILVTEGFEDVPIWTTEFGWITDPAEEELASCLDSPSWQDRQWQIVSQTTQAENLVGAFEYAAEHWDWMGAMFVFNLNFNEAPYYEACEQMRFYGVAGRPAEQALTEMEKVYNQRPPEVTLTGPESWSQMVVSGTAAFTQTFVYQLTNVSTMPVTISLTSLPTPTLPVTVQGLTQTVLSPTEQVTFTVWVTDTARPVGVYSHTLQVETDPAVNGYPRPVRFTLLVVEEIYPAYLPVLFREE